MRNFRFYMILQWLLFLPVILPLCMVFGAVRGAVQMADRVLAQLMTDISPAENSSAQVQANA